jgi:hypothetical protein
LKPVGFHAARIIFGSGGFVFRQGRQITFQKLIASVRFPRIISAPFCPMAGIF